MHNQIFNVYNIIKIKSLYESILELKNTKCYIWIKLSQNGVKEGFIHPPPVIWLNLVSMSYILC